MTENTGLSVNEHIPIRHTQVFLRISLLLAVTEFKLFSCKYCIKSFSKIVNIFAFIVCFHPSLHPQPPSIAMATILLTILHSKPQSHMYHMSVTEQQKSYRPLLFLYCRTIIDIHNRGGLCIVFLCASSFAVFRLF